VANGTIEDDLAPSPNAQRNGRVKTRLVEGLDRAPNRLDILCGQSHPARVRLAVTLRGYFYRIEGANGNGKQISKPRPLHQAPRW
jgi:hypothetical protein